MITTNAVQPLHSVVNAELRSGEKLLWVGQPDAKRQALRASVMCVFAIPWTFFALNSLLNWRDRGGLSWGSLIFQIPFVLIGVAMFFAPLLAYIRAQRTVYALTEGRILLIEGGRKKTVASYENINLNDLKCVERTNESGDLIFAREHYKYGDGEQSILTIKLMDIPDVRQVEQLVRSAFGK